MKSRRFERPVAIFVGLGFPREVETVIEAYQVLTEWPNGGRGPLYEPALASCRAALAGNAEPASVGSAFEAFARERGILASDALAETAMRAAREWIDPEAASGGRAM